MTNRGVIIIPPLRIEGAGVMIERSDIPPIDLRRYALYWDRIDWPDNNLVSLGGSGPETELLQQTGVLSRTRVVFSSWSGNVAHAFGIMQLQAFAEHSRKEPGSWSIAQGQPELYLPSELTTPRRTIEVELYEALPVPTADVPLDRVLEFKAKRQAELLQFRARMDDLYQEVISAADIPRAKERAIERVQTSIDALVTVMDESHVSRILSSVKVELNVSSVIRD